jgi:tetratricopeptide (TPR) repeat protein
MQITELLEAIKDKPLNFIWGAGCSTLSTSMPMLPEALRKYEHDPLLASIKSRHFERTAGLEDLHSCLLALSPRDRSQILNGRPNWADVCMAELLRSGRAARLLTANFDNDLVKATAKAGMLLPLYRKDHPELRDAETPCIYLLGDAGPEVFARLVTMGANTGPWVVMGASGKHFGLSQTLLSIDRLEHGLYWVGHFSEAPPPSLGGQFFTSERNAHWISGFDADSFMVYLLRALGHKPEDLRAKLDNAPQERADFKKLFEEVDRLKTGDREEVRAFLESQASQAELAQRLEQYAPLGLILTTLAEARSPRETKPFLIRAVGIQEPDAAGSPSSGFADLCCRVAQYSCGEAAEAWYRRAEAPFAQMDFGPACGAPMPYGHLPHWAGVLTEWACYAPRPEAAALFDRARAKHIEWIEKRSQNPNPRMAKGVAPERVKGITSLVSALHRRARMVDSAEALALLNEARTWVEQLRSEESRYEDLLTFQLFREAEVSSARQAELVAQAEEILRRRCASSPNDAAGILCNWASALAELGLYAQADEKFRESEQIQPDSRALRRNWSSTLVRQARPRGGSDGAELRERARNQAERTDAIDPGEGSYNLACLAAQLGDRAGVELWLTHSADHGKIPPLSHILGDADFLRSRDELWFRQALDRIFDAGLV